MDHSKKKMNPVCVTIFDIHNSKTIETKFYDVCVTIGEDCGKAEELFGAIDSNFSKDWINVVAVGLDNTATNMGCRNSIKTRVLSKNPNCFIAGCNCHLSHLAASKGADAYSATTGHPVIILTKAQKEKGYC